MKKSALLLCLCFLSISLFAQVYPPDFQWVQQIGGEADTQAEFGAADDSGNLFVVGTFKGTFSSGNTVITSVGLEPNVFILKLSSSGQTVWIRQFYGPVEVAAIATDNSGNLVLTGKFQDGADFGIGAMHSRGSTDIFLVKYDAAGGLQWIRQAGGPGSDYPNSLVIDPLNNCYITGSYQGFAIFGGGAGEGATCTLQAAASDVFVARYQTSGILDWAKAGGSVAGFGQGNQVVYDSTQDLLIVAGAMNQTGFIRWIKPLSGETSADIWPIQRGSGYAGINSVAMFGQEIYATFHYNGECTVGNTNLSSSSVNRGMFRLFRPNLSNLTLYDFKFYKYMGISNPRVSTGVGGELYCAEDIDPYQRVSRLDKDTGATLWSVGNASGVHAIPGLITLPSGSLIMVGCFKGPSSTLGFTPLTTTAAHGSFLAEISTAPHLDWIQQAAGAQVNAGANALAIDRAGNRYVAGWFSIAASFSGTEIQSQNRSQDAFLAKYDRSGALLWVRQAGSTDWDIAQGAAVDRMGNCYVSGTFRQTAKFSDTQLVSRGADDMFLAKYSQDGKLLWVRQGGGTNVDIGYQVALDAGGNCYMAGYFEGTAQFGTNTFTSRGNYDIVVLKYSPSGELLWARQAGGASDDRAFGIAVDDTGNCFITGYISAYSTFGTLYLNTAGNHDVFLAKYNSAGVVQWAVAGGGTGLDNGYGVALDRSGNVFVTGFFTAITGSSANFGGIQVNGTGAHDAFVAKYSPSGKSLWVKSFAGTSDDQADGITVDRRGFCYVTGSFKLAAGFGDFTLTSKGGEDAFLARLDPNGKVLWAKQVGGTDTDHGYSVAMDGDQNWSFVGGFGRSAQFDSIGLMAATHDMFLATAQILVNNRRITATDAEGVLGEQVSVPIRLMSLGDENGFTFTLKYDPTVLTNPVISPGDGNTNNARIVQLVINNLRANEGVLGIMAALGANETWSNGSVQVLTAKFTVLSNTPASTTTLSFGDDVLPREVDNAMGDYLICDYYPNTINIIRGYEGDIWPRPGGDKEITSGDWAQAARFVSLLDTVTQGDEFVRSDCHPYLINTTPVLGDGLITLADYIEIGRLAAGLDPKQPQGGVGQNVASASLASSSYKAASKSTTIRPLSVSAARVLRIPNLALTNGQTAELLVQIDAQGDENAIGFSLSFDSGLLTYSGAQLGPDLPNGSLVLNTSYIGSGKLGVLIGVPAGQSLAAGTKTLLRISVKAASPIGSWTNHIDFADFPVKRQLVDATPAELAANFQGATVLIGTTTQQPKPTLSNIRLSSTDLQFDVGDLGSATVVVEASENLIDWQPVLTNTVPGRITIPSAASYQQRYFRAVLP